MTHATRNGLLGYAERVLIGLAVLAAILAITGCHEAGLRWTASEPQRQTAQAGRDVLTRAEGGGLPPHSAALRAALDAADAHLADVGRPDEPVDVDSLIPPGELEAYPTLRRQVRALRRREVLLRQAAPNSILAMADMIEIPADPTITPAEAAARQEESARLAAIAAAAYRDAADKPSPTDAASAIVNTAEDHAVRLGGLADSTLGTVAAVLGSLGIGGGAVAGIGRIRRKVREGRQSASVLADGIREIVSGVDEYLSDADDPEALRAVLRANEGAMTEALVDAVKRSQDPEPAARQAVAAWGRP